MCSKTLAAPGLSVLMTGSAFAGVSAAEAARLGVGLTPLGAEMAGKPIPGKYKNGVFEGEKYFSPKGMARSGVRWVTTS